MSFVMWMQRIIECIRAEQAINGEGFALMGV